ncbi:MAG: NAD(P)H-binding protein [Betaproteobacteria bacterium]|nr:NAD(P)H-binding protein [Betaproteobacteria bacterium]MDH4324706.1 NAD(P)H-binding protein [Betaproteobacteria bacterium]MDH5577827.1 NAD(P)H-binding protein [Betaproteobacteria bacterium]
MAEGRAALLAGATGLVGSFLLERLLVSPRYARVVVWARRDIGVTHPKLAVEIVDFERLATQRVEAEDVYCCLGTTIRQAGSQKAFRHVDFDFPVALAGVAARSGAKRFLVVSSLGANPRSRVFYNRVKGEMEEAVRSAGVPKTWIFRPSLLSGPRKQERLGEKLGLVLGKVLGPLLGKYRPIHAERVAAAMLGAAELDPPSGVIESAQMPR